MILTRVQHYFYYLIVLIVSQSQSIILATPISHTSSQTIPTEFVSLQQVDPSIIVDMRYFTSQNFIGTPINGYQSNTCLLTQVAANALKKVQTHLKTMALTLRVYDCYRPQRAVDHFIHWQKQSSDLKMKDQYYPKLQKQQLFKLGYIASRSGHSRGSTVDLTIDQLDMGSSWDFFGAISHTHSNKITHSQRAHRLLLKVLMEAQGFTNYNKEWWHYTLKNEQFSDTYFDFIIQ
jgi:zinc D-Ala-D-Ala dipeptidase